MTIADFTLLVPTYDRPRLLRGLLNYYNNTTPHFAIHVLDSSGPEAASCNKQLCQELGGQISYIKFDETLRLEEKLLTGVRSVKTNYVAFCADDDVIFSDSIGHCISYLHQDSAAVGCHGIYFGGSEKEGVMNWVVEYLDLPNLAPTPIERIMLLLSRYQAPSYAVFRRDAQLSALTSAVELASTSTELGARTSHGFELAWSCCLVAQGPVAALPLSYGIRNQQAGYNIDWEADPNTIVSRNPLQLFREYSRFRNNVLTFLSRLPNHSMDQNTTEELLDAAAIYYYSKVFSIFPMFRAKLLDGKIDLATIRTMEEGRRRSMSGLFDPSLGDRTAILQSYGWPTMG